LSFHRVEDFEGEIISADALRPDMIDQWRQIRAANPELESPFYSATFTQAVARVHPHTRVAILRHKNEIKGFFPFQFSTFGHSMLKAAERVGSDMSDYFGLIAAPDITLAPQILLRLCDIRSLGFDHLDETQAQLGLIGDRPEPGLRIRLPNGKQAYWTELRKTDKHLVGDTERRLRKLVDQHGPLRFELAASDTTRELSHLIAAKRQQYGRTGVQDALSAGWREELLKVLATTANVDCRGVLSVLYAGDTWVASHFGLRGPRLLHYWFPVYNPELKAFSPGRLLLKCIIDAADEAQIETIDRGAGNQPAKRDFANDSHSYSRGVWSVPGPRAFCFRALKSIEWRLAAVRKREP